ncbi:MAG: ABC transporter ATP-binding protein [Castellaniella sp.]
MSKASAPATLAVENLTVHFEGRGRSVVAVHDLSFTVRPGETLGIVGESGCGKSVTSLAVMRLLAPSARIVSGRVRFEGEDLLGLSEKRMRAIRGNAISMIFQEPMTSLNPVFTVGRQIAESIMRHQGKSRRDALQDARGLLDLVQVPDAGKRLGSYPHELSGGMRQRVMIAIALACRPRLLIADEPTTALDVTIQAQILRILNDVQAQLGTAIMFITHDLGVVAETCDRVLVMYAGNKVEEGRVDAVLHDALHPYTRALIQALPSAGEVGEVGVERPGAGPGRLAELPGIVPVMTPAARGCAFASRCPRAIPDCATPALPRPLDAGDGHRFWCRPGVQDAPAATPQEICHE